MEHRELFPTLEFQDNFLNVSFILVHNNCLLQRPLNGNITGLPGSCTATGNVEKNDVGKVHPHPPSELLVWTDQTLIWRMHL